MRKDAEIWRSASVFKFAGYVHGGHGVGARSLPGEGRVKCECRTLSVVCSWGISDFPTGGHPHPPARCVHTSLLPWEGPLQADPLHMRSGRLMTPQRKAARLPPSAQPCDCEANHRKPSCNLWILKRDAKGQGAAWGLLGSGGRGASECRAAVLWFHVETVRGRGRPLGLEAATSFGFS